MSGRVFIGLTALVIVVTGCAPSGGTATTLDRRL